ncbi:uncharacterized protein LOC135926605 isoform X1 [Gordionus sp. m RMFG-2023]|uniref:uncharacterized protein LOC135926605 isoform X1 n=1 Tax=Gordionus sp. m RMFG-2023 TaxID=3053472 RepID=UPI0031FDD2D0
MYILQSTSSSKDHKTDDELEKLLIARESEFKKATSNAHKEHNIRIIIESFEGVERIDKKSSVFIFWESKKFEYPKLYKLVLIALAVPASQVSVERAFSELKFVLSPRRTNINPVTSDTKSIYENKLLEHYRNSTQIPSINKLIIAYLLTKKVEVIGGDGNLLTVEETEGNLDLVDNIIAKRIQELTYYYRINLGYCNDSEFMKIFS